MIANKILLGVAIGDAVGVPVEFKSRLYLKENPVTQMMAYGTHKQPIGTWSDDSSLTFCLAESLTNGYDLMDIAKKFIKWVDQAYWTAHDNVFDCGITTGNAIDDLRQIVAEKDEKRLKSLIYEGDEFKNGNGSLMRIAPLILYIQDKPIEQQFEIIKEVSALTHRHIRAAIACLIYLKFMEQIIKGETKEVAYENTQTIILDFFQKQEISEWESSRFLRILEEDIQQVEEDEIRASGYVIDSLEACFWCILNTDNFKDAILKAVNLGEDTDTTAAIVGGVAGILYGTDDIPRAWKANLVRIGDIESLAKKLDSVFLC